MVSAESDEASSVVINGGQIREVAVQVNVLSIGSAADPTVIEVTLNHSTHNPGKRKLGQCFIAEHRPRSSLDDMKCDCGTVKSGKLLLCFKKPCPPLKFLG